MVTSVLYIPFCVPYSVGSNVKDQEEYDTEKYQIVKNSCDFINSYVFRARYLPSSA